MANRKQKFIKNLISGNDYGEFSVVIQKHCNEQSKRRSRRFEQMGKHEHTKIEYQKD